MPLELCMFLSRKRPFICAPDLRLSATKEHGSMKSPSSTSQFRLYWIIPISVKMCRCFSHFFLQLPPVSLFLFAARGIEKEQGVFREQDPKEEAVTHWLHFFFILSKPLQSGFHPLLSGGTDHVKVTGDLTWLILSLYLTYKWHVISLIYFLHLDSSTAFLLIFLLFYWLFLLSLLGWFLLCFLSS